MSVVTNLALTFLSLLLLSDQPMYIHTYLLTYIKYIHLRLNYNIALLRNSSTNGEQGILCDLRIGTHVCVTGFQAGAHHSNGDGRVLEAVLSVTDTRHQLQPLYVCMYVYIY